MIDVLGDLAFVLREEGNYAEAERFLLDGMPLAQKTGGGQSPIFVFPLIEVLVET